MHTKVLHSYNNDINYVMVHKLTVLSVRFILTRTIYVWIGDVITAWYTSIKIELHAVAHIRTVIPPRTDQKSRRSCRRVP